MKQYLLPESGRFYKANLHMHTTVSDGTMTPEETKKAFLEKGYSIVAFTDHEVLVPQNDLTDDNFLAITSFEAAVNDDWPGGYDHVRCYHLNLYAKDRNADVSSVLDPRYITKRQSENYLNEASAAINYRRYYSIAGVNDLIRRANEEGFLVSYNHPVWSNQRYPDYAGLKGLWGVEVFNGGCNCGGYIENTQAFDDLLHLGETPFPLCTDDAHAITGCFRGWTQVKAESLEYGDVMSALEKGDFYSSIGPEINELYIEDNMLHIKTSEVREIFLRSDRRFCCSRRGTVEAPVTEATFNLTQFFKESRDAKILRDRPYFRLEVVDHEGRSAYTRAYFVDEIQA